MMRFPDVSGFRLVAASLALVSGLAFSVDGRAQEPTGGPRLAPNLPFPGTVGSGAPNPLPAAAPTPDAAPGGNERGVPPYLPFTPWPPHVDRPPVPPPTHPFRRCWYDGLTMGIAELVSPDFDTLYCCGSPRYDQPDPPLVDFYRNPHPPGGDPLAVLFHTLNPAAVQYHIDRGFAYDVSALSPKPATPCIPRGMFYDQAGLLGALKYYNEADYTVAPISGPVPTVQKFDFRYAPFDWHLFKLDVTWQDAEYKRITPGWQVTLGTVDNDWGSWVHGAEVAVSWYKDETFTGGRANWILGWKPAPDSPLSTSLVLGANRVVAGELVPVLTASQLGVPGPANQPLHNGFWRGTVAGGAWYNLTPNFTVGVENDFFLNQAASEYLILPHANWIPIQHVRLQVGGGWYHLGDQDQGVVMFRVDLFNPSPRAPHP